MLGAMRSMALTASAESLTATQSTYSSVASISARKSPLNTGRPGPLLTKRSAVTVTMRTSPSLRAASRCLTWPRCRRSKVPCACTTMRPAARLCAEIALNSSTLRILSRGAAAARGADAITLLGLLRSMLTCLHLAKVTKPVIGCFRDGRRRPYRRVAPIANIIPHNPNPVDEFYFRRPVQVPADLGDIGPGARRLARPLRDMDRGRRSQLTDQLV